MTKNLGSAVSMCEGEGVRGTEIITREQLEACKHQAEVVCKTAAKCAKQYWTIPGFFVSKLRENSPGAHSLKRTHVGESYIAGYAVKIPSGLDSSYTFFFIYTTATTR
jgi:hypothetical protein